jgi:hypothetical protein
VSVTRPVPSGSQAGSSFFTADLFCPSDTGLVPRVKLTFDPSCVKEFLIGPGQHMETRESSVRYYLDSKIDATKIDATRAPKYPGVEVNTSKTPFKGD